MQFVEATDRWERYFQWNWAIADRVFGPDHAGRPVYLDLEDHVLSDIAAIAEPGANSAANKLFEVVKATLVLDCGPSKVFAEHFRHLNVWHDGSMLNPPPTLGLLGALSLVAEAMHEGEGMSAHNFWDRLAEFLDLDDRGLNAFRNGYRRRSGKAPVSSQLWESLNDWLEMLEGNRGLPTAFALGHEHIGLPLSQALVRETDRERFNDLFEIYALPPGSLLPAFEMQALIDEWVSRQPCPASNSFVRLWKSGAEARERITDVAVLTLESWDGSSEGASKRTGSSSPVDAVRAKAVLRAFPSRSIEIGLVVPGRTADPLEAVEVINPDGSTVGTLMLTTATSIYLIPSESESIDSASFLDGEVLLQRSGTEAPLRRRARRAVPMRHDDFLPAWVECERVQLAEEALILLRSELRQSATALLQEIARPGFAIEDALPGLPEGWIVLSGVQIVSSIPVDLRSKVPVDLNVLQPSISSQAVLEGGLQIPGNIAKWSTSLPPELRATAGGKGILTARLTCTRPLTKPQSGDRENDGTGAVLIWDLAQENLGDGDYEISVYQDGKRIRSMTLRLRSAEHSAVRFDEDALPIVQDPGSIGFGLVACRSDNPVGFRGVRSTPARLENRPPPTVPDWYSARRDRHAVTQAAPGQIRFPAPLDSSCMVTGSHFMTVEIARRGVKTVEGVCKNCGLVKRYPAFHGKLKSRRRKSTQAATAPRIDVSDLVPVRTSDTIDWSAAFDAVCHVGSGPASALARIAAQLEGTALFGDTFERSLEQLGHIEIERECSSMAAENWEVVEPLILGLSDGSAVLAGFRSDAMLLALKDYVLDCQGSLDIESADAPPVVRICGLSSTQLLDLTAIVGSASNRAARYVPRAAEQLCADLPPLSRARQGLPTTTTTNARGYERWDPVTARFKQTDDVSHSAAFRLTGFARRYIYRTAQDVAEMRATIGDARIVKYLAAADAGRPLVGYDSTTNVLYVPLGADLPGLYGRVATLCSGNLPLENFDARLLEYRNVPAKVAAHLSHLLLS